MWRDTIIFSGFMIIPTYIVRRSLRARSVRLSVYPDGRVTVSAPRFVSLRRIQQFVESRAGWIGERMNFFRARGVPIADPARAKTSYLKHKEAARTLVHDRLAYVNQVYGFSYKRVCIKNQRTRWGSCSKKGNLNFSYRLLFLPLHLADYVIVHELCHLKEMNHAPAFWELVSRACPTYVELRRELRGYALHTAEIRT